MPTHRSPEVKADRVPLTGQRETGGITGAWKLHQAAGILTNQRGYLKLSYERRTPPTSSRQASAADAVMQSPPTEAKVIKIAAVPARDLPWIEADGGWGGPSVALQPARLRRLGDISPWTVSFLVAWQRSTPVAMLALLRHRGSRFGSALFDPPSVAPHLFGEQHRPADRYLLIGGSLDLVSGAVTAAELAGTEARYVTSALVDAAFAAASADGLTAAALYVRDSDLPVFLGADNARASVRVGEFASLRLPCGDMNGYLSSLSHGRRSVVRRDFARIADLGLTSQEVPGSELIDEAIGLVGAVKQKHQVPDHPTLIRLRLTNWCQSPGGAHVAFAVRERDGRLIGASFACHYGSVLEMHEIGLADDTPNRHLAYVETLLYAPLRYALRNGCREIHLGLGSTTPKKLRGAEVCGVWAIGNRCMKE